MKLKKCITCGVELINRGSAAKFCEPCRVERNKELDRQSWERKRQKRIKSIGIRFCQRCNIVEISSDRRIIHCPECYKIIDNELKREHKRRTRIPEKRRGRNKLDVNFKDLNPDGRFFIPKHFDTISLYSSKEYTQRFSGGWVSVLKRYGKLNEFKDYIIEEYIEWAERTGLQTVSKFFNEIGVSGALMDQVIYGNELREIAGFSKYEYTEQEYKDEFYRVLSCFDNIPFPTEFHSESKINMYRLAKKLKFTGDVYIQLLQYYKIPHKDIVDMLERQKEWRRQLASTSSSGKNKIPEEDLIADFKNTFDNFIEEYGTTPSHNEFHRLAKYGKNTLINRLEMAYSEVAEVLGYDIDVSGSPSELVTLKGFENVLSLPYEPQARFNWLKSDLNKHLRCDGYFKKYSLIVEFDGRQHFVMVPYFGQESFERTIANDKIKNKLIPKHGLTLIRIAYDEPYYDESFLKLRLLENGITPPNHTVIYDSHCPITQKQAI